MYTDTKRATFLPLLVLSLLLPWTQPHAAQDGPVILPLDSTQGIAQTYRTENRRLEVADGPGAPASALLFGGHAPEASGNKYFGIMAPLAEPVDLTKQAVRLDARTMPSVAPKAFYVRLYNQGESKPAWSFQSWDSQLTEAWRTFTLQQGLCLDGLSWEPGMVENRTATKVDRIEFIIGTGGNNVDVAAIVDNVRLAERKPSLQDLEHPKRLVRDTIIVQDGQPKAIILHPDSDPGRAAAQQIANAIKAKAGVAIPTRAATESDRQPGQTAILIGNVHTNPAMLLLYARYMTPVDAICPGTAGALVHTVFDPFGKGVNAIVAGASGPEGLAKATHMLCTAIETGPQGPNLILPRLFERAYGDDFVAKYGWADDDPAEDRLEKGLAEGQAALDTGKHTSIAGVLRNVALRYQLTGHSVEAKLYVKLWERYAASAVADPRKFGGPWGFDSDFPSAQVVPGWRNIEYDPALTDAERLATVKAMGRWLAEAVVPSCAGAAGGKHVPHNHQTFPALGALFAGLYFSEGFDVAEGETWLGIADAIFQRQAGYAKPYEDCNGYQWLTNGHLMHYTVARPDFALYENGNARKIIDYCLGTMDNLGYQVPYGDTGSWQCWDTETYCLDTYAFVTGDAAAAWAASRKHQLKKTRSLYAFQRPAEGEVPEQYNGVRVWPLDKAYYDTHGAEDRPPFEQCFDKVSFREAMAPGAPYLLLDGLSNGGHKHFDGNSIPRITQFDRIWLADNDYYKSAVKYHNSMMVFKDGESAQIPSYVELLDAGETERCGFSKTRVNAYAGVDWERTVIWFKAEKAFVVLETLTPQEASEYQFRLLWHGIGQATLHDEGLLLEQKGPSLWFQIAPGPELRLHDDTDLGGNWNGYEHADPVVRSLSAIATVRLDAGQPYTFATAIHGAEQGTSEPWTITYEDDPSDRSDPSDLPDPVASRLRLEGNGLTLVSTPPPANLTAGQDAPALALGWRRTLETHEGKAPLVSRLASAKLDGSDQPPTILIATKQGVLFALTPDSQTRWTQNTGAQINDVTAADINGDGTDEVCLALQDHRVLILDAKGENVWERELEYYRRPPCVNVVRTGDVDGDGLPEVIAGGENWRFYAFDGDGTELWNFESVHPSRSGAVADLDGDGTAEVLCGTHYYYMSALNPDGTRRWKQHFGPICYDIATGSFDGDATRGVVCGGGDGCVHYFAHDGQLRMRYNTGDEVKHVLATDLDGDGKDEIVAGSLSHSVYGFGADGVRKWRTDLGAPITALAAITGAEPLILAGTDTGTLAAIGPGGAVTAMVQLGSAVVDVLGFEDSAIAATGNGELVALKR